MCHVTVVIGYEGGASATHTEVQSADWWETEETRPGEVGDQDSVGRSVKKTKLII